jgi:hypothetical protein
MPAKKSPKRLMRMLMRWSMVTLASRKYSEVL